MISSYSGSTTRGAVDLDGLSNMYWLALLATSLPPP